MNPDPTRSTVTPYTKDDQLRNFGKDGQRHPRGCDCRPCMGKRNRRSGLTKQRAARQLLGVPLTKLASMSSNEENWRHRFRIEVKSGLQVKAMYTRFLGAEKQAGANKADGDPRGFMFVAMPKDTSDGLVCIRLSTWARDVAPLLNLED